MEQIFQGKPPWKRVEWVRSPSWAITPLPIFSFGTWVSHGNEETLSVKEQIGTLDKEHKWELAKKMVNPYEIVYTHDDERLPPSLSLEQPLSRSYFKMVEMLDVMQFFQILGKETHKFRTAHVAEGPGGFIQAIASRAEHYKKHVLNSFAMTLRPTTSHVPGWKKAAIFLQKNRHVKIHYGADGTGNIYIPANHVSFQDVCGPQGVHLFTADGGFDFSIDYSCQEQRVFQLLVNSSMIGLRVLKKGGHFILKLFDCVSPSTRALILLLGRSFAEWTLYKPAMTRPCNSERYFLGKGYRGLNSDVLTTLEAFQFACTQDQYPQTNFDQWIQEHEKAFFTTHNQSTAAIQILSIKEAIGLSSSQEVWWSSWLPKCLEKSLEWCEAFHVMAVPRNSYLNSIFRKYHALSAHIFQKGASPQ